MLCRHKNIVEYDATMKTRTNQPMQKYRCSYKAFKWSKHSQKHKLWVFLQYEGREMYYSDSWEFCVPVVHISYLEVAIFIFSFHSKSMSVCVRLTYVLSCLLLCCISSINRPMQRPQPGDINGYIACGMWVGWNGNSDFNVQSFTMLLRMLV